MTDLAIETFKQVLLALAEPVMAMQKSTDRVFVPYLGGALVLSTFVWHRKLRGKISLVRFLLHKDIWLHNSALFDLRFMVVRAFLALVLFAPIVISSAHLATAVQLNLKASLGPVFSVGPTVGFAAVSVCAFVGEDFARYLVHGAAHRVPMLWELHKVHHSAKVLTPFTIYRTHPLEGLLMRTGASLGLAVAAGISAWALGTSLTAWEVMGVHGISFAWNLTGSNLRHSHVWLRYPSWLERVFISPAQHQIHHSDQKHHYHSNYGSVLAIWDWMFGSLYVPKGRERLTFGLPEHEANHEDRVVSALFAPVRGAVLRIFGAEKSPPVESA